MLEEYSYPDKIEVLLPARIIQVRIVTEVKKDGDIIASSFFRYTLEHGSDVSDQPDVVAKVCAAIWA